MNALALSLIYGPTLTSTHDYWKNHRFDYVDFCEQSNMFLESYLGLSSNPAAFKVRIAGDSQSLCQIPRLGSLLWGLARLQQCKNFFGITVLQFVYYPPGGSVVGLMVTSSTRTYAIHHASQACFCQSPCPHGRPLKIHASTVTDWCASVSCGITVLFPGSW